MPNGMKCVCRTCPNTATNSVCSPYMNDYCDDCTAFRCDASGQHVAFTGRHRLPEKGDPGRRTKIRRRMMGYMKQKAKYDAAVARQPRHIHWRHAEQINAERPIHPRQRIREGNL